MIGFLYKLKNDEKKFKIIISCGCSGLDLSKCKNNKSVKFGASKYQDYTQHKDKNRRRLYRLRHSGMNENYNKSGIKSAGFWSFHLLWGPHPNLDDNIKYIERKFDINIIKKNF